MFVGGFTAAFLDNTIPGKCNTFKCTFKMTVEAFPSKNKEDKCGVYGKTLVDRHNKVGQSNLNHN